MPLSFSHFQVQVYLVGLKTLPNLHRFSIPTVMKKPSGAVTSIIQGPFSAAGHINSKPSNVTCISTIRQWALVKDCFLDNLTYRFLVHIGYGGDGCLKIADSPGSRAAMLRVGIPRDAKGVRTEWSVVHQTDSTNKGGHQAYGHRDLIQPINRAVSWKTTGKPRPSSNWT